MLLLGQNVFTHVKTLCVTNGIVHQSQHLLITCKSRPLTVHIAFSAKAKVMILSIFGKCIYADTSLMSPISSSLQMKPHDINNRGVAYRFITPPLLHV